MRSAVLSTALVAIGVVMTSHDARSQTPELAAGARVRWTTAGSDERVAGRLIGQEAERLVVETTSGHAPVVVPFDQATRLQVSDGRNRSKAALIGALVGVAATGVLFATTPAECAGSGCVKLFALIALPAATTGGMIGAAVAPERWRDLPKPRPAMRVSDRLNVGVAPARGGVRVAASVRF